MGWNNGNGYNGGGNYGNGYNGGGNYGNGNNYNGGRSRSQGKKKSGCTAGMGKNNKPYVQGFRASRKHGLRSFFAFPYKGTKTHKSKASGIPWENWLCTTVNKDTGEENMYTCLYNPQNKKVTIGDLGYVMNPKGGKGGYVGTFSNNG